MQALQFLPNKFLLEEIATAAIYAQCCPLLHRIFYKFFFLYDPVVKPSVYVITKIFTYTYFQKFTFIFHNFQNTPVFTLKNSLRFDISQLLIGKDLDIPVVQ